MIRAILGATSISIVLIIVALNTVLRPQPDAFTEVALADAYHIPVCATADQALHIGVSVHNVQHHTMTYRFVEQLATVKNVVSRQTRTFTLSDGDTTIVALPLGVPRSFSGGTFTAGIDQGPQIVLHLTTCGR